MSKSDAAFLPRSPAASIGMGFIVICLLFYILHVARAILIPFVIAVFVWYLINAMARSIGRQKPRGYSIPRFLSFLAAILILLLGIFVIVEIIGAHAVNVAKAAPVYQQKFRELAPQLLSLLPMSQQPTINELMGYFNIEAIIAGTLKLFTGFAGKTLIVMFYTGFLLYEQKFFDRKIIEMIEDKKTEDRVRRVLKNIDIKIQRYISVKTFISVMIGLCTYIALKTAGLGFAGFWGLVAFILNFIPFIGALVSVIVPSIIMLVHFGSVSSVFAMFMILSAVHMFWSHWVEPRMMGDSLNLSPIFIILSMALWLMIWGVPGLFLSMPVLAVLTIVLSRFLSTRPIAILFSKEGRVEKDETISLKIEKAAK